MMEDVLVRLRALEIAAATRADGEDDASMLRRARSFIAWLASDVDLDDLVPEDILARYRGVRIDHPPDGGSTVRHVAAGPDVDETHGLHST